MLQILNILHLILSGVCRWRVRHDHSVRVFLNSWGDRISQHRPVMPSFRSLSCSCFSSYCLHFVIKHLRTETALSSEYALQPGQVFLSFKYAMHVPQFMPHGAINDASNDTWGFIRSGFIVNQFIYFCKMQFKMSGEINNHGSECDILFRT